MANKKISRKNFITNSFIGLTGIYTLPNFKSHGNNQLDEHKIVNMKNIAQTIKNVRLETGFEYDDNHNIIATNTDLFTVEIANGKITSIHKNEPYTEAFDAKGLLMLPAFKDMHIHLDKTIYADKWQAVRPKSGVKEMIALEQQIMPTLLKNATYKAEKIIELLQSKGSYFARSHVNIEPTSKFQSLHNLEIALNNKKDSFATELVIFPQHGLFYTDSLPYMEEAAKMNIDFIGGLDPMSIDGSIEKTIDTTVRLALDNQKGIDIHLHETGPSGLKTVEYLIDKVNENPFLKDKTFISHSFVLGKLEAIQLDTIAEKLADAKIGIISTVPFGKLIMPIPQLMKHGVKVAVGNDSIVDHWNTFGTGSVLEKANLAAQLYGKVTEFDLSRLLKLATAGPIPLDDDGTQQWPKVGDDANLVLLDASCSAEAVARVPKINTLIFNGHIIYE